MKDVVCIGMAGAGRAAELHMNAFRRVSGVPLRFKRIVDRYQEQASLGCTKHGFEEVSLNINDLLSDPEIDVLDICTPPFLHESMIESALAAGKHVICEKPLTGYFGEEGDKVPIGLSVPKSIMYEKVLQKTGRLERAIAKSGRKFMYAENFLYAPSICRAAELIACKKSRILFIKGEESVSGSSSMDAGQWCKTGGGAFIRIGTHPLSAALWLKREEAAARGESVHVRSVLADMGFATRGLSSYERRHLLAKPLDVEDSGTVILDFSDDTRAVLIATDTRLGGSLNTMELYCNDAVIHCQLTLSDLMQTHLSDAEGLDRFEMSEMLPMKLGWNSPSIADDVVRGYAGEMQDFMEAVFFDREPKSGFALASETIRIIYAAYLSAEEQRRVYL